MNEEVTERSTKANYYNTPDALGSGLESSTHGDTSLDIGDLP
jgi:hypothetical protein